jgi:type VI secretion system protein ImpF
MARLQSDATVTLSVLDRLIDRQPDNSAEAPLSRAQSVRELRKSVRRDLEWLLNTRRNVENPGETLPQSSNSVYVFGLPDFSSFSVSSPADQARLHRDILAAIKLFEPRLTNVRLVPMEDTSAGMQRVRLRIEAMLKMDPAPEPISFDTLIELRSGVCRLTGDANAR